MARGKKNHDTLTRADYMAITQHGHRKKQKRKHSKSTVENKALRKHYDLFKLVSSKNPNKKQREALIETLNKEQMGGITKLVKDFLNQKYTVPPKTMKQMKKDKAYIYALINSKTNINDKKQILKQKGGFLGLLAPLAGALLPGLLGPVIGAVGKIFKRR